MKRLKTMWAVWKRLMKKVSVYQSKFLLSLIYIFFISPVAIMLTLFSDPLQAKGKPHWQRREKERATIEELQHQ